MTLGERISTLRKEQNISQGQLAQALEVSRQAVSKWENDLTAPDTIKLIQLADVLNTEVEYLATGNKPVYQSPPIVVNVVERVDKVVEKVVEKPVIQYKKLVRTKYLRNPAEYAIIGTVCFAAGLIIGMII